MLEAFSFYFKDGVIPRLTIKLVLLIPAFGRGLK